MDTSKEASVTTSDFGWKFLGALDSELDEGSISSQDLSSSMEDSSLSASLSSSQVSSDLSSQDLSSQETSPELSQDSGRDEVAPRSFPKQRPTKDDPPTSSSSGKSSPCADASERRGRTLRTKRKGPRLHSLKEDSAGEIWKDFHPARSPITASLLDDMGIAWLIQESDGENGATTQKSKKRSSGKRESDDAVVSAGSQSKLSKAIRMPRVKSKKGSASNLRKSKLTSSDDPSLGVMGMGWLRKETRSAKPHHDRTPPASSSVSGTSSPKVSTPRDRTPSTTIQIPKTSQEPNLESVSMEDLRKVSQPGASKDPSNRINGTVRNRPSLSEMGADPIHKNSGKSGDSKNLRGSKHDTNPEKLKTSGSENTDESESSGKISSSNPVSSLKGHASKRRLSSVLPTHTSKIPRFDQKNPNVHGTGSEPELVARLPEEDTIKRTRSGLLNKLRGNNAISKKQVKQTELLDLPTLMLLARQILGNKGILIFHETTSNDKQ